MVIFNYIVKNMINTVRKTPAVFIMYVLSCIVSVTVVMFSHGVYQNYQTKVTELEEGKNIGPNGGMMVAYPPITFGNVTNVETFENEGADPNDKYEPNTWIFADGATTVGDFRKVLSKLDEKSKNEFGGFFILYDFRKIFELYPEYNFDAGENSGLYKISEFDGATGFTINMTSRIEYVKELNTFSYHRLAAQNEGSAASGKLISDENELNADNVIVLRDLSWDSEIIGKRVHLFGKEYEVIGIAEQGFNTVDVPFSSLPNDLIIQSVNIQANKPISTYCYRHMKQAFEDVYGEYVNFPEMYTVDTEEKTFYVSIMMISVVLSVLAAIILAILYRYIIFTRRKTMSVMRLNGCTRGRIRLMYLIEIIGSATFIFALCGLAYHKLILPRLTYLIDRIGEVYSLNTYLYIYGVFIGVLFVVINIMISTQLDKQPVNMFRR